MKRFWLAIVFASFIGLLAALVSMIAGDLAQPENWGVVGHRDPRLYLPVLTAIAVFVGWMSLQSWLNSRRARTTAQAMNHESPVNT